MSKRVQVTLSDEDYALVQKLARLNSQSMASVIGELLESVSPVLRRVAQVHELAHRARAEQVEGLRKAYEETEKEVSPLVRKALQVMGVDEEGIRQAMGEGRRPGRGPQGRADPRMVTTGVRLRGKEGKTG